MAGSGAGAGSGGGGGSAVERHPHLADPRPAGTLRVDCHAHTMWSGDSTTTPDELAEAVADAGIDVLCVTDHGTIAGARRLAGSLPCQVVVGQEQRTPDGEVIGLYLRERIPHGLRSAVEAARAVRAQGGLVYLPHPFDPMRHRLTDRAMAELVEEELVDVVEVLNAKTSLEHAAFASAAFAVTHELSGGAGSDAHVPEAIGAAYVEVPAFDVGDPAAFLAALEAGRIVGHRSDPARPWRPRVVPSTRQE